MRNITRPSPSILVGSLLGAWTATASAQWSLVNLHPAAAEGGSQAFSVSGGQQAGIALVGNREHASVWNGTAASWADLNPVGTEFSDAFGESDGRQVGYASVGMSTHAMLWSGTVASMIDLNPAGATGSGARAISGNQQVGTADFAGVPHAGLWSGTAASWVDLGFGDPRATDGTYQVGANGSHAVMWSGTAASRVDLHPSGLPQSGAYGVQGGQQVGMAIQTGGATHAALWSGTAASYINLNPVGSQMSEAFGVWGGYQVGYAKFGNTRHAGIWNGTAASWVDLAAFLPPGFGNTEAFGIWSDGGNTYVVGYGNPIAGNPSIEALMWQVPAPSGLAPFAVGAMWTAQRKRRRADQRGSTLP